jgi:hypothetical protein
MIGGRSVPKLVDTRNITALFGAPQFVSGLAVSEAEVARSVLLGGLLRCLWLLVILIS